jgi:hypothetical protein
VSAPAASASDLQAGALVDAIARKVEADRRALLDAAAREVTDIRQLARRKARRQLQRAVGEMRATDAQRMLQARAELETRSRREASQRALALLSTAAPLLPGVLLERWRDPGARARWIDAQLAVAVVRLGTRPWQVRHPATLGEAGVAALHAALAAVGVHDARLSPDAGLAAGLVIEADGASLDSSPRALLADRPAVEAALLAQFDAAAAEDGRRE